MVRIRSGILAALIAALSLLVAAVPAQAKGPGPGGVKDLRITPKRPQATDTIVVSFRAGKIARDERYVVDLVGPPAAATIGPAVCSGGYRVRVRGVTRPGRRIRVELNPNDSRGWPVGTSQPGAGRFCPGEARVGIGRVSPDDDLAVAGTRKVSVVPDAGFPPPLGTPVKVSVLDGSAITVRATGRPDRTMALGGLVRGAIPGVFRPNTDVPVGTMVGGLFLKTLQTDAICGGGTFATELPLTPKGGPSNMLLKASGEAIWTVQFAADPLSLAGCAAPASPAPVTVTLSGKVTSDGLLRLPLTGSVPNVPIATGVTATVTFNLLVNVDLSGTP